MSPRLPRGALLALTVAMTAATAVMAAPPAGAGQTAHATAGQHLADQARIGLLAPSDAVRNSEWWLASLHVTPAWQSSRGAGVTVALLSTGVQASHPDLTGSVISGPDYTGSGESAASPTWGIEGTSAASIIAGHGDNTGDTAGIIGIAPAARILSIRVSFDAADPLNGDAAAVGRLPDAIAEGIRYAVAHGAQVIDLPLDPATLASDGAVTGGLSAAAGGSDAERAAVSDAISKGAVLVAPAGDNGEDGDTASFPAAYPGVIALAAVDRHFVRAPFSSWQSYVALSAPGVDVTAASPPSGYRNMSTTDAASAMVAGVAALIRSRYPALSSSQVRQALVTGSVARPQPATTAGDGAGTVDALKAIQAAAAIAAGPHASASARPSPAISQPTAVRPLTGGAKPGTVGLARSMLRDAAMAAGMLIVLLLASLVGIRLWRRRAEHEPRPGPEPRTLLSPPPGPLPGHARGAQLTTDRPVPPLLMPRMPPPSRPSVPVSAAAPSYPPVPYPRPSSSPGGSSPAGSAAGAAGTATTDDHPAGEAPGRRRGRNRGRASRSSPRISAHGLRLRVTPVSRTATRTQVTAPGGPPWEPAPAPEGEVLNEPRRHAPDPFTLTARPTPTAPAPWETAVPGQPPMLPPSPGQQFPQRGPYRPTAGLAGPSEATGPFAGGAATPGGPVASAGPAVPGGLVSSGGTASHGGLTSSAPPGFPARPISPLDRLPLSEPPGPAGPGSRPRPATPWRIPGVSPMPPPAARGLQGAPGAGTTPGPDRPGGEDSRLTGQPGGPRFPAGPTAGPVSGPVDPTGYSNPTRPADRTSPGNEPSGQDDESPSGPLYVWNPAALTEPFPLVRPPAPGQPGTPGEEDTDTTAP